MIEKYSNALSDSKTHNTKRRPIIKEYISRISFLKKKDVNNILNSNETEKAKIINQEEKTFDTCLQQHEHFEKAKSVIETTRCEKGYLDTRTMSFYSVTATYFIREGLQIILKKGEYVAYNREVYTDQMKYLEDCKEQLRELSKKGSVKMDITIEEALKVIDIIPYAPSKPSH